MSDNPYKAPSSNLEVSQGEAAPALLNPDIAGVLSLFLSPIFGSYIIAKNWEALGVEEKQESTHKWLWASVGVALLSFLTSIIGFVYIVVWYFAINKPQAQYLKEHFAGKYPRRAWGKPVLVAIGAYVAFVAFTWLVIF